MHTASESNHASNGTFGFHNSGKLKSSSLQSLERGRSTEVENYNGYIATKGRELSVSVPVNEQLTRMIREIEEGKRKISADNFREIKLDV